MNLFKFLPQSFKDRLVAKLKMIRKGLAQESVETQEMLRIYLSFTQGKASREEMRIANEQFRDLLKTLGLGTLAVLPFSPLTLPIIVKLGRRLGVDVLPSSFKNNDSIE